MGDLNVEDMRLLLSDPDAARAKCEQDRLEMLELTADVLSAYLRTLLAPVDAAALTGSSKPGHAAGEGTRGGERCRFAQGNG